MCISKKIFKKTLYLQNTYRKMEEIDLKYRGLKTKDVVKSLKRYGKRGIIPYKSLDFVQRYIEDRRSKGYKVNMLAPQKGSQEAFLRNRAGIKILHGNRGGGKSVCLGMDILSSCNHPSFSALVFRKDKTSAEKADGILKVVSKMVEPYGEYIDSKRLSRLDAGGEIRYDYFGDACLSGEKGVSEFKDRQQGGNVVKVAIDECSQATEPIINYLQTVLRSSSGLRTSLIGACNPNPYSDFWRAMVSWWVDDDGIAIPERSGKVRYFFQYGDTIHETAWGDSPQEVFAQAKDYIIARFGKNTKIDETNCKRYIKSITFIASGLEDNKILMASNPDYQKNLGGTAQEVSINALGSWKLIKGGNEWITRDEMEEMFSSQPVFDDYFECATLDIAYGLGDVCVMGHFIGHHLQDLEWSNTLKPRDLNRWVRNNLRKWGIGENRLAFDGLGAPTFRDAFPESLAILRGVPKRLDKSKDDQPVRFYFDLRAQLADEMVTRIKGTNLGYCGFSINPELLEKPYVNKTIREALMDQRRAIRRDVERENGKLRLLKKQEAKKIVGCSPDLIEGTFLYRTYFDICDVMIDIPNDIMDELKYL